MQWRLPKAAVAEKCAITGRSTTPRRRRASSSPSLRENTISWLFATAGPTGYGLYRLIKSLGHDCIVAAPSLIPSKPGDRVKTNRRDAVNLAKLLRAGELTAVWVPDERHEAMRDPVRARDAAARDYRSKRQNVSALLLRLGLHYPGKKTWGRAHIN